MPEVVVTLNNVQKTFRGLSEPALKSISGSINKGIVTGLVGPDGAGKTTLLRLIAGLLLPDSGAIHVLGRDPGQENLHEIIGYMPQKFGLYEELSVRENLMLHADLRNVVGEEREQIFKTLLKLTNLTEFTSRMAGKLSGGMKQKLGLACALLGQPKLLLLDEPGVGVDPVSRRELWKVVQNLTKEGISVVWSTAYLDEAELCQDVFLLKEGQLLYKGRPSELTSSISHRCFQLRGTTGDRRKLLMQILNRDEVMDAVIQGDSIRLVMQKDIAEIDPMLLCDQAQSKLVPIKSRFEDAFIDILGGTPKGESVLAKHMREIMHDGKVVIEAEALTKKFGDFVAADSISFKVFRGEMFCLLGPNGAGKSTAFKMMCGLLPATSGRAEISGIDLRKSPSLARQKIGYMAQKFSLYEDLRLIENLKFFAGIYGLKGVQQRKVVSEMVEMFHLQPFSDSKASSLSLGFKQRLALACAVMHEPEILFLDEPTSGMDLIARREFWAHMNGLAQKGVTIMVTTHFMDETEYCDRVGFVYRGKLIANGTPDQLKAMAKSNERPEPTMEDAFVHLVNASSNLSAETQ